ncbi:MAG TPA: ATP-dependent Clp protease ATP-binding subunit [Mollicutes bacterium]|nr:ATP-dependent Clp protease ATP-binding subunit [Mollicutes bacterium]
MEEEILDLSIPEPKKLSMIERYGEDLTANTYVTNPAIAREEEIKKMILALLIPDKSAILVGKPGIGKTAIVEGLAYKIQNGNIPNALKDFKIIKINLTALLGTNTTDGNEEIKLQVLIDELKTLENTILFIDEIHNVIGTGAVSSSLDFANMLKSGLDRGTIKIIGATTDAEYNHYLVRDRAFLRRFEKIEIDEPDQPTTVKIIIGSLPRIEKHTGVKFDYSSFLVEKVITFLVNMTSEYKRMYETTSRYPDVTFALVSKIFSFAMFDNSPVVRFKHIWEAVKTCQSIYPDVLKKEKKAFIEEFSSILNEENVDINEE